MKPPEEGVESGSGAAAPSAVARRSLTARVLGVLRLVVGLGLVVYVVRVLGPETVERFRATTAWLLPAMALLPFLGAGFEAVRMRILFGAQGIALSRRQIFRVALMGAFFNVCVPGITTGGDLMRVYFFSSDRPSRAVEVFAVLIVDRLVSLLGLLTVVLVLAIPQLGVIEANGTLRWLFGGCALTVVLVVAFGAVACSRTVHEHPWRDRALGRLPLGRLAIRFADAVYRYRSEMRTLGLAWLASLPGHLTLAAMFALGGHVLLPDCPTLLAANVSLVALLANILPLTPGGLGVGELAFDRLFAALGHEGGASLQLAWRAAMAPAVISGGVLYALGKWRSGVRSPGKE